MSKILILIIFLAVIFYGCDSKAPGCTDLSWGETSQVEDNRMELKYSAGTRCGNIDDYWDIDIEEIISSIQKMKLTKNSGCVQENTETGEDETVECPDFVPETIEFGEVTFCSFGTPPDKINECDVAPMVIKFDAENFFDSVSWEFNMYNPDFNSESTVLFSKKDAKTMMGQFNSNDLTSVAIKFTWNETVEGVNVKKEMGLGYSVETKE